MRVYVLVDYTTGHFLNVFDSLLTAEMTIRHNHKGEETLHLTSSKDDEYQYSIGEQDFVVYPTDVQTTVTTL